MKKNQNTFVQDESGIFAVNRAARRKVIAAGMNDVHLVKLQPMTYVDGQTYMMGDQDFQPFKAPDKKKKNKYL